MGLTSKKISVKDVLGEMIEITCLISYKKHPGKELLLNLFASIPIYSETSTITIVLNESIKIKTFIDKENELAEILYGKIKHELNHSLDILKQNDKLSDIQEKINNNQPLNDLEYRQYFNSMNEFGAYLQEIVDLAKSFISKNNIDISKFSTLNRVDKLNMMNRILNYCKSNMREFFKYINTENYKKIQDCLYRYLSGQFS